MKNYMGKTLEEVNGEKGEGGKGDELKNIYK